MSERKRKTRSSRSEESLQQRLERYPELKHRVEALLAIVENRDESWEKADDAELAVVKEVRPLAQQVLGQWAQQQADRQAAELRQLNPSACQDKKKLCTGIVRWEKSKWWNRAFVMGATERACGRL